VLQKLNVKHITGGSVFASCTAGGVIKIWHEGITDPKWIEVVKMIKSQ
jgi:hypothetical protein